MADVEIEFNDEGAEEFFRELTKDVKSVSEMETKYLNAIAPLVIADVFRHFEQQAGADGGWKPWSQPYEEHMKRIGKTGNMILQDSGRLRNSIVPGNYKKASGGVVWYTNAKTKKGYPYAAGHDEGDGKLPQRSFMWLSSNTLENIESLTMKFVLGE